MRVGMHVFVCMCVCLCVHVYVWCLLSCSAPCVLKQSLTGPGIIGQISLESRPALRMLSALELGLQSGQHICSAFVWTLGICTPVLTLAQWVLPPPHALFSDPQKRIPKGYPEREPNRDGHSNKVSGVRKLLQEWKRHLVSSSGEALGLGLAHFTQRIQAKESLAPDISDCQLPLNALLKKRSISLLLCAHTCVGSYACGGQRSVLGVGLFFRWHPFFF